MLAKVDGNPPLSVGFQEPDALHRPLRDIQQLGNGISRILERKPTGVKAIYLAVGRQSRTEINRQTGQILQGGRKLPPVQSSLLPTMFGNGESGLRTDPIQDDLLLRSGRLVLVLWRHLPSRQRLVYFCPEMLIGRSKTRNLVESDPPLLLFLTVTLHAILLQQGPNLLPVVCRGDERKSHCREEEGNEESSR